VYNINITSVNCCDRIIVLDLYALHITVLLDYASDNDNDNAGKNKVMKKQIPNSSN